MKFKRLKQNNPRLDVARMRVLKALYKGGQYLLGSANRDILSNIFPKYIHEPSPVYEERCRRAYYEPIFGQVINQISAHLSQDPIQLRAEDEEFEPQTEIEPESDSQDESEETELFDEEDRPPQKSFTTITPKNELDPYWMELQNVCTPPGDQKRSLDQLMRDVAIEGLVCGWAWLQVDLPKPDEEMPPQSLAEQEERGDLFAYFVPWPSEQVTDWERKDGALLWVRTYQQVRKSEKPEDDRDILYHVYKIWDAEKVSTYVFEEDTSTSNRDLSKKLPNDEDDVSPIKEEPHTFGRVPWICFDTDQSQGMSLHVGEAIASLCIAYFNRTNGESFQWTQHCYQQLYEFLGPEVSGIDTVISEAQTDAARAKRTRSPGEVHVRGADDRAEFVGPDMSGADVGRAATQDMRDAILRVINMMALAQDTSGAMLRRSGESKEQDNVAQEVLVGAIGKLLITFAIDAIGMLGVGRKESPDEMPEVEGYQKFDITNADVVINQSVMVEALQVPSATYQQLQKFQLACAHLGEAATPEVREKIWAELQTAITQDDLNMQMKPPEPEMPFGDEEDDSGDFGEEEPADEEEEEPKKANPFAKGGAK